MATGHDADLSDVGKSLFKVFGIFYSRDPDCPEVEPYIIRELLEQEYPHNHHRVVELFDSLDTDPPVENFRNILLENRLQAYREQLIMAAADKRDNDVRTLWQEMEDLRHGDESEESDEYVGTDPLELLRVVESGNRVPLVCDSLTRETRGGALPGHHLLFFGRPEVGKSLTALNLVRTAAEANRRVGYWENEDPIAATQLRAIQCLCDATEEEVRVNLHRYRQRLEEVGWNERIFWKESADGSVAEIENWVAKHALDVVVVNQLPNLKAGKADTRVQELWTIARGLRALAKRQNCVVASVSQAGDSADGRRVLRMGDLDGSNTAVQGQVDLMVGIGMDDALEQVGQRCLSVIRNKLSGSMGPILCSIDVRRNRIE